MQLQQQRLQMQRQMEQQRLRQQQMADQQRRQREMMAQQRALREQQRQQREQMRQLRAQREQQKLQRDQQRTQREQQQALREQRASQDAARVTRQQQSAQRQQQTQRQATQTSQRQSALSAKQQQAIRARLQQTQKTKQLDDARRRAQQTLERKRVEDARKKAETAAVVSARNAMPAAAGGGGSGKPPNGQPKAANDNRRVAVSAKLPNTPKSTVIKFPGPKLPDTIAATFQDGKYSNVKLSSDRIMYKYHGVDNRTGQKVTWLTDRKYSNETELRRDLAIKKEWGVKLTSVSAFKVPKGTWISEGKAAGQGEAYPGGGYQAVVQNVPKSWLIRTDRAFQ